MSCIGVLLNLRLASLVNFFLNTRLLLSMWMAENPFELLYMEVGLLKVMQWIWIEQHNNRRKEQFTTLEVPPATLHSFLCIAHEYEVFHQHHQLLSYIHPFRFINAIYRPNINTSAKQRVAGCGVLLLTSQGHCWQASASDVQGRWLAWVDKGSAVKEYGPSGQANGGSGQRN
ncbi:hypothetical protein B0T21DRAFT_348809 [Apiosordaria backusii]|uniref:Uncharacterized protein n=1 Tax=Apiosordaria backusii TaxID=314023 RepID=A0AA40EHZ8_9PEZI|nr:hypothetical protein B0T21DRAFT_348809 [Apiosordaria backusii]